MNTVSAKLSQVAFLAVVTALPLLLLIYAITAAYIYFGMSLDFVIWLSVLLLGAYWIWSFVVTWRTYVLCLSFMNDGSLYIRTLFVKRRVSKIDVREISVLHFKDDSGTRRYSITLNDDSRYTVSAMLFGDRISDAEDIAAMFQHHI